MQVHNVPRNSSPVKTSTNGVRMHMNSRARKLHRSNRATCLRSPYCRKCINQSNQDTYDVPRLPQDSHVSRPFFGRKQVRPEDTAALTNGHIERGTRGALS